MRGGAAVLAAWFAVAAAAAETTDAEKELYAARYKAAAELYRKAAGADSNAYYGLVRALIKDHRSREAYAAAEEALSRKPQTAGTQAAAGLASFRRGDPAKAEEYFHAALRLDPAHPGALKGLASVHHTISHFKTARELLLSAYRAAPGDPELMFVHANTLEGAEHIAALKEALAILDPETEEARFLRAHIATDTALGERTPKRLTSPYVTSWIPLFRIEDRTQGTPRRFGVRVLLNQAKEARLLLDTGASGVSISPKLAERAGLEKLGDQPSDAKGVGDRRVQPSYEYLAAELRAGDVVFADYPVSVFRSAKASDWDGIIGADVFSAFLVTLDFSRAELIVEPRAERPKNDEPADAGPPAAGFFRAFRLGNHLAVQATINKGPSTLFLIDSGASATVIDREIGGQALRVYRDARTGIKGIQGDVNEVSRADHVTLSFAGFRQQDLSVTAISLERSSDSMGFALGGLLGIPALSGLRVTIDYEAGTVRMEKGK